MMGHDPLAYYAADPAPIYVPSDPYQDPYIHERTAYYAEPPPIVVPPAYGGYNTHVNAGPPPPRSPLNNYQDADTRSTVSDAWTLALSDVTQGVGGEPVPLNLMEELMLLKAGDKSKYSRNNPTLDRILAAALLLELVLQRKVALEGESTAAPRNLVMQIIDDSHTGSNLINSAIRSMKKRSNQPQTIALMIERIAGSQGGLTQRVLWRLVQKKKVAFDPQVFGSDKYPVVGGAQDLQICRDRVVRVMDRSSSAPDVRDLCLAFLYYLPKNATDRIFGNMPAVDGELYAICKGVAATIGDYKETRKNWL